MKSTMCGGRGRSAVRAVVAVPIDRTIVHNTQPMSDDDNAFIYPRRATDVTEAMLAMPVEELTRLSRYPLTVHATKQELYESIARTMAGQIEANNAAGRLTRWILPIGPKNQYPILARITNEKRLSWKNVWAFHMDEWLDWQGRPLPLDHSFSLRGQADRLLYDLI